MDKSLNGVSEVWIVFETRWFATVSHGSTEETSGGGWKVWEVEFDVT